jgi:ribA/ribD-fused uncharacterized protein
MSMLKLDTDTQVFFYEQDHYYLSNFSSFRLKWRDKDFDTSEHVYHWEKFDTQNFPGMEVQRRIVFSRSAHEAFKIAEEYRACRRAEWDTIRLNVMSNILRAKAQQHEYVRRKLIQTGECELIENSWRDNYWGWGPNRDGQNMLGKLWMEIRAELMAQRRA